MDKDPTHVDFVKRFGNQIFYGDAKRMDLLEIAGIKKARVFVIAVDDIEESLTIAKIAKTECPNLKIVARAHNRMHVYQLMALGVESINREMFESSLLAAKDTLMAIGYTESQAIGKVDMFRHHDLMMLEKAAAHKDDIPKLISIAKEGRKELEDLFKQDHS
jgi:CPA2 family monovalent cation:H+ antiporter-2